VTVTTTLLDRVRAAVADVPDPELPPVTLGMLGMVHDVTFTGGEVRVELLPTFAGCPATEVMERDVVAAAGALEGVDRVTVRFRYDPPWTPDRIDEVGRERLREFGIAPPGAVTGAPVPDGRVALPLLVTPAPDPRPCPYCGSDDTERESSFGPTPCRDVRFCRGCQQPFEAFKP
jgi:ring-1,2-phenylacetyl-CoA epoxidase subunit PaaD